MAVIKSNSKSKKHSKSKTIFALFDGQLVSMFGNAVQAENCADWGDWGPCEFWQKIAEYSY
jgi:hypothetical protein